MKFINVRACLALLVLLTPFKGFAILQSPEAWGLEAQQTTLFNGGKYYLVLAKPFGDNHFQAIGIDTVLNTTGTYDSSAFEVPGPTPGNSATKIMSYFYEYTGLSLSATNTGALIFFYGSLGGQFTTGPAAAFMPPTYPLPSPLGNMLRASGTAPASPNVSYNLTITEGNAPFSNQGSRIFKVAADGTYAMMGASNNLVLSSGTYSYEVTNTVAGCFNINDSANGDSTIYFCYYSPSNGFFMRTQTGGGYQAGTFDTSGQVLLPAFFNDSTNVTSAISFLNFADGTAFGYYNAVDFTFPLFYHYDMGFEWFFDANNDSHGAYLYDFSSSTFFYTDPALFPYLYDFTLQSWLYYFPDTNNPGHYTSNPRWFYQFSTDQFINK